jgi:uncharacterized membrane protein
MMNKTAQRNAVLVYLAVKDHQLAIFADEVFMRKQEQIFGKRKFSLC